MSEFLLQWDFGFFIFSPRVMVINILDFRRFCKLQYIRLTNDRMQCCWFVSDGCLYLGSCLPATVCCITPHYSTTGWDISTCPSVYLCMLLSICYCLLLQLNSRDFAFCPPDYLPLRCIYVALKSASHTFRGVGPCGSRALCRIVPPHFLAECHMRRLNQG